MFNKIKLFNLVNIHNDRLLLKKIIGGSIIYVKFKRTVLEKQFYNFNGFCISNRNRGIGSNFIIRNVIGLYPLEYTFNKYSPLISFFIKSFNLFKNKNERKSKLYFLRKKSAPFSFLKFEYVN